MAQKRFDPGDNQLPEMVVDEYGVAWPVDSDIPLNEMKGLSRSRDFSLELCECSQRSSHFLRTTIACIQNV
jgi:hypothetical protein